MSAVRVRIINLTKFPASDNQVQDGVFEASDPSDAQAIRELVTFRYDENGIPDMDDLEARVRNLIELASKYRPDAAMVGGPNFFQSWQEHGLTAAGIIPVHSCRAKSRRRGKAEFGHGAFIIGRPWLIEHGLTDTRLDSILGNRCPHSMDEEDASEDRSGIED